MELDVIYKGDCLEGLKKLPDGYVDLIVTDPPYEINNARMGNPTAFGGTVQRMFDEIKDAGITTGFDVAVLDELMRVMRVPNIYIWCNSKQIPMYLDYFVTKHDCCFDILCWVKTNAMPLFNNKYLSDKEYCLYFRRGGYCNPTDYESAKTVFFEPINVKDKKRWGHPTIKPLGIIQRLVKNSSKVGGVVLDPFMGSGTTAVAAIREQRRFIGFELDEGYFQIATERIEKEINDLTLF